MGQVAECYLGHCKSTASIDKERERIGEGGREREREPDSPNPVGINSSKGQSTSSMGQVAECYLGHRKSTASIDKERERIGEGGREREREPDAPNPVGINSSKGQSTSSMGQVAECYLGHCKSTASIDKERERIGEGGREREPDAPNPVGINSSKGQSTSSMGQVAECYLGHCKSTASIDKERERIGEGGREREREPDVPNPVGINSSKGQSTSSMGQVAECYFGHRKSTASIDKGRE